MSLGCAAGDITVAPPGPHGTIGHTNTIPYMSEEKGRGLVRHQESNN